MLRKRIDTTPGSDDQGIEKFLTPAGAAQPILSNEEEDGKQDTVRDEGAAHNEVGQALSEMVITAEAQRSNTSKEHLHPTDNRHRLSENAVQNDDNPADPAMNSPFDM
jgi:hypothetical protein